MIKISSRSTVNDELVVIALQLLEESVRTNGVQVLNDKLEQSRFNSAEEALAVLGGLAVDINMDQKFLFDNSEPLRIAIHIEGGVVEDILPSKQVPMQVAVYDYDVGDDEDEAVSVFDEDGARRSVLVANHVPSYLHAIDINDLFVGVDKQVNVLSRADHSRCVVEDFYKVVVLSTAHLTESDKDAMELGDHENSQMIMKRDTGFFVKLYDELESNYCGFMSESLLKIIRWAHHERFSMIEFDSDARELSQFETFDW